MSSPKCARSFIWANDRSNYWLRAEELNSDHIQRLRCPYSGSPLAIKRIYVGDNTHIEYGVVSGDLCEFPIVAGILRLLLDEYQPVIVSMLAMGDMRRALLTSLDGAPFQGRAGAILSHIEKLAYRLKAPVFGRRISNRKLPLRRVYESESLTFVQTARRVSSGTRGSWQVSRFTMPTFLPTYALLHAIKGAQSILDFGCGTGQAAFLISRIVNPTRMVCADYSFSSLYLAKKYFAPNAEFICLDGDFPLPFENNSFSSVFSSDAIHFIDSKLGLAGEFRRVLDVGGSIVLPHLHNKNSGIESGKPLSVRGYSSLFEGMEQRIYPEESITRRYICDDEMNIDQRVTVDEVADAVPGVSLIASDDSAVFRRYSGLWDRYVEGMENPVVNPIYRISNERRVWHLKKHVSDFFSKPMRCNGVTYVPEELRLELPSLDPAALRELKVQDRARFSALARQFVVIDVPKRFQ